MIEHILRILKSNFSLPLWVIAWMYFFLVPANLSGFFLLSYESGFWIALLGGGAILINIVIIFINGGFSKVLALSHLVLWIPLEFLLIFRLLVTPDLSAFEQNYILIVATINAVSIAFDFYDTKEWYEGNRDVAGFPGEPVKL